MAARVIKVFALGPAAEFLPNIYIADASQIQLLFECRLIVLGRKSRIWLRASVGDNFYTNPFEQIKEVLNGVVRMSDTY